MGIGTWGGLNFWSAPEIPEVPEVRTMFVGDRQVKDIKYFNGTELLPVTLSINSNTVWGDER